MKNLLQVAALLLAAALPAAPAAAQEAGVIALDQLEPSPAGDPFFGVPSPFIGGHLVPRAQVLFSHAGSPLVFSEGNAERRVVAGQSILHLGVSLALFDRLQASALLPLALAQSGDGVSGAGGEPLSIPEGPALGDLRLGLRVRVFGEERSALQIGTGFALHVPTGASGNYMGEGAARVTPQVHLGGHVQARFAWSILGGVTIRGSDNPSTVVYGAGVAWHLWGERLQLGPEIYAATPLHEGSLDITERSRVAQARATRLELLVGARVRLISDLSLGLAAGPGLTDGVGTPAFRVVGALAWSPRHEEHDTQASGPIDTDADGVLDVQDACPYAHGPSSAEPKLRGCPFEDWDEDRVPDGEDACPDHAGVASPDPAARGCPPDVDRDGVPDLLDACPMERGPAESVDGRPGCPAAPGPR